MAKLHIFADGKVFYATDELTSAMQGTEAPVKVIEATEENMNTYLTPEERTKVNDLNNMIQSNQR